MFASGISSSAQQNIASFQAQQQQKIQQQFQSLAAEFQSGGLTTAQASALEQQNLPSSGSSATPTGSSPSCAQSQPAHWHHRPHIRLDSDSNSSDSQTTDPLEQLFSADPSSAQQAYGTLASQQANASGTQTVSLTV